MQTKTKSTFAILATLATAIGAATLFPGASAMQFYPPYQRQVLPFYHNQMSMQMSMDRGFQFDRDGMMCVGPRMFDGSFYTTPYDYPTNGYYTYRPRFAPVPFMRPRVPVPFVPVAPRFVPDMPFYGLRPVGPVPEPFGRKPLRFGDQMRQFEADWQQPQRLAMHDEPMRLNRVDSPVGPVVSHPRPIHIYRHYRITFPVRNMNLHFNSPRRFGEPVERVEIPYPSRQELKEGPTDPLFEFDDAEGNYNKDVVPPKPETEVELTPVDFDQEDDSPVFVKSFDHFAKTIRRQRRWN